jgi:CsoR family transcriptional regulator, copper-sensing transcriptional repressor
MPTLKEAGESNRINPEQGTERDEQLKSRLITRLNRIEGQVRGIKGMIRKDIYCDDVLNQISAVQAALDAVSRMVLENHLRTCLVRKIRHGEDDVVDELLITLEKMM